MGYSMTKLTEDVIKNTAKEYEYALLYKISEKILDRTDNLDVDDLDEVIEGRFFSEEGELHVFREENVLRGVLIRDSDQKDTLIEKYDIEKQFRSFGRKVLVKKYLNYDEDDGQAYVEVSRLAGIVS